MAVMQADLKQKQKQAFWETPRNLALIFGALVAGTAALAGLAGYKLGQSSPPPLQVIFQPGSIVAAPAPAPPPALTK